MQALSSLLPRFMRQTRNDRVHSEHKYVHTLYTSAAVDIPDDFLKGPEDEDIADFMRSYKIDFKDAGLPEYENCYAVVLDGVLTRTECQTLLKLAEASVPRSESENTDHGNIRDEVGEDIVAIPGQSLGSLAWKPAMVNVGPGVELLDKEYRNSDRIIWDRAELIDRLWSRVCMDQTIKEDLKVVKMQKTRMVAQKQQSRDIIWNVTKLNERMRFLRYGEGQYFRPHCDGPYRVPGKDERTFYTLHFYLNDSAQEMRKGKSGDKLVTLNKEIQEGLRTGSICEGGATTFHSSDCVRSLDVDPKAGRVLIFQHARLYHSGAEVSAGVKYTMRSDLQYEKVCEPKDTEGGLWDRVEC